MGHYLLKQVGGDEHLSIFLGFWSTLTNALFAYIGTELIGVTVGEAENPRKNIPKAIRRTFYRILVFYIGGVFVIRFGLCHVQNSTLAESKYSTKLGGSEHR